jgi:hypothetical protein
MRVRVRHQSPHHIAQPAFGIRTRMVKLVNANQRVVEILVGQFLEGIAQRGVRAHQCSG